MKTRSKALGAGALVVAGLAVGGVAVAQGGDEVEQGSNSVTQQQRDAAEKAALKETGGGTANAVERDAENGATFEVEVTKPDGATVDVRLDENYAVLVVEGNSENDPGDVGDEGD